MATKKPPSPPAAAVRFTLAVSATCTCSDELLASTRAEVEGVSVCTGCDRLTITTTLAVSDNPSQILGELEEMLRAEDRG